MRRIRAKRFDVWGPNLLSVKGLSVALVLLLASGCIPGEEDDIQGESKTTVQSLEVDRSGNDTHLSFHLLATDQNGQSIPCRKSNVSVDVRVDASTGQDVSCSATSGGRSSRAGGFGHPELIFVDDSGRLTMVDESFRTHRPGVSGDIRAVGPSLHFDWDGQREIPYVKPDGSDGPALYVIDMDGTDRKVVDPNVMGYTTYGRIGVGDYDEDGHPDLLYPNDDKSLYRADYDSAPTQIVKVGKSQGNDAKPWSVLGASCPSGQGRAYWVDNSSNLKWTPRSGPKDVRQSTLNNIGTNNNAGAGDIRRLKSPDKESRWLARITGGNKPEIVQLPGPNAVNGGKRTALASVTAQKVPPAFAEFDDGTGSDLVFVGQSGDLHHVEAVPGAAPVSAPSTLVDASGNTLRARSDIGVVPGTPGSAKSCWQGGSTAKVTCADGENNDLALVLDNSGSQEKVLARTQKGARELVSAVTKRNGRASLVRTSTFSKIETPLTSDESKLRKEIDDMFVNDGWSALYDGIRMGNSTLTSDRTAGASSSTSGASDLCGTSEQEGIVVFTNGRDNNSAEQKLAGKQGDAVDTTRSDLRNLRLGSTRTPIYTIGLGSKTDHQLLSDVASTSGARHLKLSSSQQIPKAFGAIKQYAPSTARVCVDTPDTVCGDVTVDVNYTYERGQQTFTGTHSIDKYIPCECRGSNGSSSSNPPGVATILMALSRANVPRSTARRLAGNAVDYASPTASPKVLVFRDANPHGQAAGDLEYVADLLKSAGYTVEYRKEPSDGLSPSTLDDYDVVWFGNPSHPMSNHSTFQALESFVDDGGGVVLSGDDMSRGIGQSFPMTPLTGLDYIDNGETTCGVQTRPGRPTGSEFQVTFSPGSSHTLADGLAGRSFEYPWDIDTATASGNADVVATAELAHRPDCETEVPVVIGNDM